MLQNVIISKWAFTIMAQLFGFYMWVIEEKKEMKGYKMCSEHNKYKKK